MQTKKTHNGRFASYPSSSSLGARCSSVRYVKLIISIPRDAVLIHNRTVKQSRASAQRLFQVKSAWLWPARDCTPRRLRAHHPTTTSTQTTQATSSTLVTYVPPHLRHVMHLLTATQLPYQAGWQDLKDLFRSAGNIIRADINIGADGRPKGSGTVIFETAKDAAQAISTSSAPILPLADLLTTSYVAGMYNGFEWYGRILEVREDRYAGLTGPGSYRGGVRGGIRGVRGSGFRGGLRGGSGFRGGFAGGGGGGGHGPASGRDFSSQDLYADYSGPDQPGNLRGIGGGGGSAYADAPYGGAAGAYGGFEAEPSQQIMVRNVSGTFRRS